MYELRPYQTELIDKIINSMKRGHRVIIVQSPPRTGKTVVMAEIAKRTTNKGNRVLFMIHRKEVLDQAVKTFHEQQVDPDLLTAGMVQTLTRRVNRLPIPSLILVDEGHHALAKSYQRILKHFSKAYVLLFTATPRRTGRVQLDQIADDIVIGQSIKELTKKGFLAPYKYWSVPYDDLDFKLLKKSSTGDYTQKSMDRAMNTKIYSHTVDEYLNKAQGKQAIVYTYSVKAAKKLAKEFLARHVFAAEVDGQTPTNTRDAIVKKFRDQQLNVLVNVDLFTEGIDLPNVDCAVMVRPTESLSLFMQFSMRCLNPRPGKTAIIIDQVSNWKKFGTPNADRNWRQAIITRKGRSRVNDSISIIQCPNCFAVIERSKIENNACPECGYSPVIKRNDPKVENVKLQEIDDKQGNLANNFKKLNKRKEKILEILHNNALLNVSDKSIGQLRNYTEFQAYAKLHGYSNGWVYVMWSKKKKGVL